MTAKTRQQRSAKCPVIISECSSDGSYITIENTGRKEERCGNWSIERVIDGRPLPVFNFDSHFSIRPGSKVKIWAGRCPKDAEEDDIVFCREQTWGIGANITTKLVNEKGEDRATHIQKTSYSSS